MKFFNKKNLNLSLIIFLTLALMSCGNFEKFSNSNDVNALEETNISSESLDKNITKKNNNFGEIEVEKVSNMELNDKILSKEEIISTSSFIEKDEKEDKFVFAGDIFVSKKNMASYNIGGIDNIVEKSFQNIIKDADLSMANLECVISDKGEAEDKTWTFREGKEEFEVIKEAGFNLFTVANNHSLDFGKEAFLDTLGNLKKANIDYVGGGKDKDEARKVYIKEINKRKYAIVAATAVVPNVKWFATDEEAGLNSGYYAVLLENQIRELKKEVDKVIIYMHWGNEKDLYSNENQQQLSHAFVNAGCDLVIGTHSHTIQEIEYYNGVPIIYSLGNFIYGSTYTDSCLVSATFDYNENEKGILKLKIYPALSGYEIVKPLYGEQKKNFLDILKIKSPTCLIDDEGNIVLNLENIDKQ